MKNCKIKMNFRGNMGCVTSLGHPQAPLGWSGGISTLSIEIVGVPDEVSAAEVLRLFDVTSVVPRYEDLGYRLPYNRLGRGKVILNRQVAEINAETQKLAEAATPTSK